MNLRMTTLLFGFLLTMLWVFGLMVAHKKAAGDQSFVVPKLLDAKIDKLVVKQKDGDSEFISIDGRWFLQLGKQKVRVEGVTIENIIKAVKEAKHDETADVSKDLSVYGLDKPKITVILSGTLDKEDRTWEFYVGNESGGTTYVNSGDRKDRAFAVSKTSMDKLAFKDPNYFRSKRLFDFGALDVKEIAIKKADQELDLTKGEANRWTFVKPKGLGIAGFESEQEEEKKKKDPFKDKELAPTPTGGVKGLLDHIVNIRVDDEEHFEPLGKKSAAEYGVEAGKERMRIDVTSTHEDKKTIETLLIGNEVFVDKKVKKGKEEITEKKIEYYYARLDTDDGVMKINERFLKPIMDALNDPGKIRSLDVAAFDKKLVDVVVIKQGKDEMQFFKQEKAEMPNPHMPPMDVGAHWDMVHGKEKKKASDNAVNALVTAVLGKRGIIAFHDGTEAELKAKEAGWGLDTPVAEIAIYQNGIAPEAKDEPKKDDAKKDDKKKDEPKKDDAKPLPGLKKDHKPEVVLAIGKFDKERDKDIVHIRRELKDGTKTYFTMKKEFAETALPPEGVELAYLDLSTPEFAVTDVTAFRLQRTTDKGTEVIEMEARGADGKTHWYIKDRGEPTGARLADSKNTESILNMLSRLGVKKWLKTVGDKENLKPVVTAAVTVKKNQVAAGSITINKEAVKCSPAAGLVALSVSPFNLDLLTAGFVLGTREIDDGETVTIVLGKDTDVEKDKPGAFASHSGAKAPFLAEPGLVKMILKADVRDRSAVLNTQSGLVALHAASAAASQGSVFPTNILMTAASPYVSGIIHQIDSEKVKKVQMTVRTPYELRSFQFERAAKKEELKAKEIEKAKDDKDKDKVQEKEKEKEKASKWTWEDKSSIKEFQVDPDKVAQLVKDFAKLRTDRFVAVAGGKRTEYKLDLDKATLKLDLVLEDDKTTITVIIGTSYLNYGYFATTSQWPDTVFFVPQSLVDPILEGTRHFARERLGVD